MAGLCAETPNVSFVRIVLLFQLQIFLTRQCLAYYQHGKNNAHYPQRICHGTSQNRRTGFQPICFNVCCAAPQRRRIGGSAAEDATMSGNEIFRV